MKLDPKIKITDFSAYADQVLEAFIDFVEAQKYWERTLIILKESMLRFQTDGFLMRKSLHDPQIPINIESDIEGGATA